MQFLSRFLSLFFGAWKYRRPRTWGQLFLYLRICFEIAWFNRRVGEWCEFPTWFFLRSGDPQDWLPMEEVEAQPAGYAFNYSPMWEVRNIRQAIDYAKKLDAAKSNGHPIP